MKKFLKRLFCLHKRKELLDIQSGKAFSHAARIATYECKNCKKLIKEVI